MGASGVEVKQAKQAIDNAIRLALNLGLIDSWRPSAGRAPKISDPVLTRVFQKGIADLERHFPGEKKTYISLCSI